MRMMRQYFTFYAPADFSDFLHWSGLNKCECVRVFESLKPEMARHIFGGRELFSLGGRCRAKGGPFLKMLGKFDPLAVAYSDKSWLADRDGQKLIWRAGGHVEALAVSDGGLVGTWRHESKGQSVAFSIFPLRRISRGTKDAIERESLAIAKFWGRALSSVDFRPSALRNLKIR